MAAEYTSILQEDSNFRKRTAKKYVLSPKFQKVRYEVHKMFTNIYSTQNYALILSRYVANKVTQASNWNQMEHMPTAPFTTIIIRDSG